MIYSNPAIPKTPDPIGLDVAIIELQNVIAEIGYVERSFGRAYIHKEDLNGKAVTVPKVYQGEKEYYNPLPNGNFKASTFIIVTGPEECPDYVQHSWNDFTRKVAVVFWGNLREIDGSKDYIFLEQIKNDFMDALMHCKCLKSYDGYVDEKYNEVFKEFSSYFSAGPTSEVDTQYLMYPFAGFRMNLTLTYSKEC